ncbi:hypothetical protein LXL04_004316 [Taraxacum kok-saghyz]
MCLCDCAILDTSNLMLPKDDKYGHIKVLRMDRTKLRVRYEELIDDDEEYIVKEVDLKHIRPYPPDSFDVNYRLTVGDDVDVYDRDGWWRGEVVFEGDDELMVYFPYMPRNERQGTFLVDDVCIHQEVKDVGKGFVWRHVKIAGGEQKPNWKPKPHQRTAFTDTVKPKPRQKPQKPQPHKPQPQAMGFYDSIHSRLNTITQPRDKIPKSSASIAPSAFLRLFENRETKASPITIDDQHELTNHD